MSRYRTLSVKLISSFLLILLCLPAEAVTITELNRKIREEENRFKILERQIKSREEMISASQRKEKSYLRELSKYDQRKKVAEQSIRLLDLKQKKLRKEISQMEQEIVRLKGEISHIKELLSQRLVAVYKFGGVAELNLLMSAQNVSDAMNTGYLLKKIAKQDQNMIGSLERETERTRTLVEGLSEREKELSRKKSDIADQKSKLNRAISDRKVLLTKLKKNRSAYEASVREFEQDQREIRRRIESFIKKRTQLASQQSQGKPSHKIIVHKGRLNWPLSGKVTSPFGTRVHPVFKTKTVHTGIDIAAPRGKTVKSAGSGQVIYSGWLRGYGQIIIIDHGKDISTVYAHLSRILVSNGESISVGQPIGLVGSTGVATGPHLHFEVRYKGDARDPRKYLGR